MKKAKTIISLTLVAALLGTAVMTLSSCGLFAKKVRGTEAAKVLLARERLDSDAVGQHTNIFSTEKASKALEIAGLGSKAAALKSKDYTVVGKASDAKKTDDSVVWSTFGDYSNLKDDYTQFIEPIDKAAEETADLIVFIKNNVGITEKWVEYFGRRYMLIVDENSETVISHQSSRSSETVEVSVRYTTEDAKCVYDMYTFWESGEESGMARNMCIPGEHYESMYQHLNGFEDYFVADKSRGYWTMNRFQIHENNRAYFGLAAVKDGLGYSTGVNLVADDSGKLILPTELADYMNASLFLPNEEQDLYNVVESYEGGYKISVYMSNIESGIKSLAMYGNDAKNVYSEDYGGVGVIYNTTDNGGNVVINLENGKSISPGATSGSVTYSNSTVTYSPQYNGNCYIGYLTFTVKEDNVSKALVAVESYLSANGVKVRSDRSVVEQAYNHCELLYENYDVTEWYGYKLDTMENLLAAEDALNADFAKYQALYEEVKDYETADWFYDVPASLDFDPISLIEEGNSTYADGILKISGMKAVMAKSDLLESGKSYILQIGLALLDENGKISSVNAVGLKSDDAVTGVYTEGDFTLSQSGEFVVPTAMSEGEYVVVAYFATAEDGIRVTEMLPVAFLNVKEGKLDSNVMDVTVKKDGENIHIKYEVKLSEWTTCDEIKDTYSYEDIERALKRGVLAKGYPMSEAVVQTADGEALKTGQTYGAGTYRLKFLVSVEGQFVEAYMYCTFE